MPSRQPPAVRTLLSWLAGRGETPEIVETHVSVLAFQGDRVYKIKKPVCFDFLDLSTPELRARACDREVALNRRLAPDVYLGVVDIADTSDAYDTAGRITEHAVEMRRMPADRRLATLVRSGADAVHCIDAVADSVARFHASAARSAEISAAAERDNIADLWERGFAEARPFVGAVLDPALAARVETLVRRYLAGRDPLFEQRIASGRICDGHGDLLADDVFCLDDGPRILDCLEFDDRLRHGDTLADVAFLAMDLELLGRPDLARHFLDRYRSRSTDTWPASLEHHYIAYRAHVRAKVACLRHAQGDMEAADRAGERLALAAAHLDAAVVRLVLIGGLPGTGKSTLAVGLAEVTGAVLLRSDVTRKELAGLSPTDRAGAGYEEGLYQPAATDAVYRSLVDAARQRLASGESVVLDASWAAAAHRHAAEGLARSTASDLVQLRCVAPASVASDRMAERAAAGVDASDASPTVAAAMAGRFDAWPDATVVDTASRSPVALVESTISLLGGRPGRPGRPG